MPSPAPVDSVLNAIGRTPVLRLRKVVTPECADVYVKLEYFNPTGSYKDRMALAMIEGAEDKGKPGILGNCHVIDNGTLLPDCDWKRLVAAA